MNEDLLIKEITKRVLKRIENLNEEIKDEVVIGISPTFNEEVKFTLNGLSHRDVIKEIVLGIEEEGLKSRIIRVFKTADLAFIGKEAALESGSGIGIGIQAKGTILIHQKDLYPLSNLELFPQAPLIDLKTYRSIGKNAAKYAKNQNPIPIKVKSDCMIRPKYQVKAALLHIKDTEKVLRDKSSIYVNLEEFI